jgi:hypothetical protein
MQSKIRTAIALLTLIIFANAAQAADPAQSPAGEGQAIQGDEGKSNPPAKTGPGSSAAQSAGSEAEAIQGNEGKSGAGSKPVTGSGSTPADNPASEAKEIEGN